MSEANLEILLDQNITQIKVYNKMQWIHELEILWSFGLWVPRGAWKRCSKQCEVPRIRHFWLCEMYMKMFFSGRYSQKVQKKSEFRKRRFFQGRFEKRQVFLFYWREFLYSVYPEGAQAAQRMTRLRRVRHPSPQTWWLTTVWAMKTNPCSLSVYFLFFVSILFHFFSILNA